MSIPLDKTWQIKLLQKEYNKTMEKWNEIFLDHIITGRLEYPMPSTEAEEQAYIKEYNDNNPHQFTSLERLNAADIIKRYKDQLTEEQLKVLEKYDNKR